MLNRYIYGKTLMKKLLFSVILLQAITFSAFAVTPEQILAIDENESIQKGLNTRKGSVGALIANTLILNSEIDQKNVDSKKINESITDIRENVVGIESIGLFDILPIDGWLSDEERPGNLMVGIIALQEMPQMMTTHLENRLKILEQNNTGLIKQEIQKISQEKSS